MPWVANDPKMLYHENFWYLSPYFNYSAPGATEWWVEAYIGSAVDNELFDGAHWDACGPQVGVGEAKRL